MSDDQSDQRDDTEFPTYVLIAKQQPPSDMPCKWCRQLQVHVLATPVRIYYHCSACLQSWYEANPKAG